MAGHVLGYPRFAKRIESVATASEELIADYRQIVARASRPPTTVAADLDEDKVLACRIAASADLSVSDDAHLRNSKRYHCIEIVTPGDGNLNVMSYLSSPS